MGRIKKRVADFLLDERGSISKSSVLKVGAAIGVGLVAIHSALAEEEVHTYNPQCSGVDARIDPENTGDNVIDHTNHMHANHVSMEKTLNSVTGKHQHCMETHYSSY